MYMVCRASNRVISILFTCPTVILPVEVVQAFGWYQLISQFEFYMSHNHVGVIVSLQKYCLLSVS